MIKGGKIKARKQINSLLSKQRYGVKSDKSSKTLLPN